MSFSSSWRIKLLAVTEEKLDTRQVVMVRRWLQHFLLPALFHITIASGLQASYNQLRYIIMPLLLLQQFSCGDFFVTKEENKRRIASPQRHVLQVLR